MNCTYRNSFGNSFEVSNKSNSNYAVTDAWCMVHCKYNCTLHASLYIGNQCQAAYLQIMAFQLAHQLQCTFGQPSSIMKWHWQQLSSAPQQVCFNKHSALSLRQLALKQSEASISYARFVLHPCFVCNIITPTRYHLVPGFRRASPAEHHTSRSTQQAIQPPFRV